MKKIITKFLLLIIAFFSLYSFSFAAWNIDFNFDWKDKIKASSIDESWSNFEDEVKDKWLNILKTFKVIIWWILVIIIVYYWVMMIISMWDNEEMLSSSKKWLWYALLWLLFVNIPWNLYEAFTNKSTSDSVTWSLWNVKTIYSSNIFMNKDVFWDVLWNILTFLQVIIVILAVFVIVLQWINIIKARWKDEDVTEAKNKIIYALVGLVFIWILVAWKNIVFVWDLEAWRDIFTNLANLALYFAWPVAIFFLSLAWYYYITWAGDEDKVKKAKNIVINTLIATLILLWMYTFLLELKDFTI